LSNVDKTKRKLFGFLVNEAIEYMSLTSAGNQFLAWGVATVNAVLLIFHLVPGMTGLLLVDDHRGDIRH